MNVLVLFSVTVVAGMLHIENGHEKMRRSMDNFAKYSRENYQQSTCNNLVSDLDRVCANRYNYIFRKAKCAQMVASPNNTNVLRDTSSTITMFYVKNSSNAQRVISNLMDSWFFHNTGKYRICLCGQVKDRSFLTEILSALWRSSILNVVILYFNNTLREASFDPFTDTLTTRSFASPLPVYFKEFPDKLKNLRNYPIKVLTYSQYFRLENEYVYSFDRNFLKSLETEMDLSLDVIEMDEDESILKNVLWKICYSSEQFTVVTEAVGLNTDLHDEAFFNCTHITFPHMVNNFVALVPKPKPDSVWYHVVYLLNLKVVGCSALGTAVMVFLDKHLSWEQRSREWKYFSFLKVLIRLPVPELLKKRSIIRGSWLFAGLLLTITYDFLTLQAILTHNHGGTIRTLKDLNRTRLPLLATDYIQVELPYKIVKKSAWKTKLLTNKADAVFLAPYTVAHKFVHYFADIHEEFHYTIMEETVQPALGAFICKHRSPFLDRIKVLSMRVREFGVAAHVPSKRSKIEAADTVLTFHHFEGVFILFIVGLVLATFAFIGEMLIKMFL